MTTAAKDSVTTKSIRDGAVTAKKLKSGAVTGGKIKPGSVKGRHVDLESLGITGGIAASDVVMRDEHVTLPNLAPGETTSPVLADCETGETAISGGGYSDDPGVVVGTTLPIPGEAGPTGWSTSYYKADGPAGEVELVTVALCVPG